MRSHRAIAAVGVVMLLISLTFSIWVRVHTLGLTNEAAPTVRAANRALMGVQRSLAGLRGWIVLADPVFKEEWELAWEEDIGPSLAVLKRLGANNNEDAPDSSLSNLMKIIQDFKESQWWILEIAQTPGNQPARYLFDSEVAPLLEGILDVINFMTNHGLLAAEQDQSLLVARLTDLGFALISSRGAVAEFLSSGEDADRKAYGNHKDSAFFMLGRVQQDQMDQSDVDPESREKLNWIENETRAAYDLLDMVVAKRESEDWNRAENLLRTEAAPLAKLSIGLLNRIAEKQELIMDDSSSSLLLLSKGTLFTQVCLLAVMMIASAILSRRAASAITGPIAKLSTATRDLARGNLQVDIPGLSNDEIGELTKSFNRMRHSINVRNAKIRDREEHLRAIFNSAIDGILTIDEVGRIQTSNTAAENMFGYSIGEMYGLEVNTLIPSLPKAEVSGALRVDLEGGREILYGHGREAIGKRKDGSSFPMEMAMSGFLHQDQTHFVGIVRDITERVEARDRLEAYSRDLERSNRDLQEFAAVASHDLQEPLRKIESFGNRLSKACSGKLDPNAEDFLTRIISSTRRMRALIQGLLAFSRVASKANPFDTVDLNLVVQDAIDTLQTRIEDSQATVNVEELPRVEADAVQLKQLFQNLIGNALKYRREGVPPHIVISCQRLRFEFNKELRGHWEIRVSDNGIGFDQSHADRIFQVFERLHGMNAYEGTGIGLAICKRVVERHNGQIRAEGEVGVGSMFVVTLPEYQSEQSDPFSNKSATELHQGEIELEEGAW